MFDVNAFEFFMVSLGFFWALSYTKFGKTTVNVLSKWTKNAFPHSSENEHTKFALIRILFGLILTLRGIDQVSLLTSSEQMTLVAFFSYSELLAGLLLAIGVFTQWVILFLVFVMWQYGHYITNTNTLGNDVGAMLAVFLFLVEAGKGLSVDNFIFKYLNYRSTATGGFSPSILLYGLYRSDANGIRLAKLATIFSYWSLCMYSIFMHLGESSWMDGTAGPLLLTSQFMSSQADFFINLFSENPNFIDYSRYALFLMMAWYFTILPFTLLGGLFKKYVVIWGWLFIFMSSFILQLGWLAEIEMLLWLALFWDKLLFPNTSNAINFIFDDRCGLCLKTIKFLKRLDLFNAINFRPLSSSQLLLRDLDISLDEARQDVIGFVGTKTKKIYKGYFLYEKISSRLFLLWPIYFIMLLFRLFDIGPRVYSYVALRRQSYFGSCSLNAVNEFLNTQESKDFETPRLIKIVVPHVIFLCIFYLISLPAPFLGYSGINVLSGKNALHFYGVDDINVFNKTDLRMSENWYTIENSKNELVPVFDAKGKRLDFHKSDRIYFGNTLIYKRAYIDKSYCHLKDKYVQRQVLYMVDIYFDHKLNQNIKSNMKFKYKQYFSPLPTAEELLAKKFIIKTPVLVCEVDFEVNKL